MALSVKNPLADQLARELTAVTGESITDAVVIALQERLERVRGRRAATTRRRITALVAEARSYPVVDSRSAEQILGYDDEGLPS
jgi:antitoxin VapB